MPEAKNESPEEISELFSFPTAVIIKRNLKHTAIRHLSRFHLRKVFSHEHIIRLAVPLCHLCKIGW